MAELKKIALIPAYQPENILPDLIKELRRNGFEVIVVNDGSGSAYDPVFRLASIRARVLVHSENRGKGEALKTGLSYIKDTFEAPYVIVTVDADGQHRLEDIVNVCEMACAYPDSLILGSRKFDKNVPLRSSFGNRVTRLVYRLSTGTAVFDTQTGLRAFGAPLLERMLAIPGSRYEYEMNVLMEMARSKTDMREVWIETVYLNQNASSHFDTIKDSCRIYKEILKFSASSLAGFAADYGMFCLLFQITGMHVYANVGARLVSSILNFTLNKKLVFRSEENVFPAAVKYFLLAACILLCNTMVLKGLAYFGLNVYFAKIVTELVLFVFSYTIQHCFVFRRECAAA